MNNELTTGRRPDRPIPAHDELARFRAIVDSSLSAVIGMDEGGRITLWTGQAERIFGYERDEVLGRTVAATLIPARMRDAHERGFKRYLTTLESRLLGSVITVPAIHRDGHELSVELALSTPVTGLDGRPEFIAFARDISDRERAERLRTMQLEVTRTLATSRTLDSATRALLEAVASAVHWSIALLWLVDESSMRLRQVYAWHVAGDALRSLATAGTTLTLAPAEGLPGRTWAAEHPVVVDDLGTGTLSAREKIAAAAGLHAAIGFPLTHDGAVTGVIEIMGAEVVSVDDASVSLFVDLGRQIGRFIDHVQMSDDLARAHADLIARDAELKRAHDALITKAADLERSNTDLEQFARIASHDLQEPLRMVASYVQLLDRHYHGKLGEDADEYISFAVDGSKRMQALITDLLAYSRAGHTPHELTSVDAGRCVDAAKANLLSSIRDSGAEVVRDDLPWVRANAPQLTQVFQNLIGNALKFHGASRPRIEVEARRDGRFWLFSVRDNGIGIDPAQKARIFQVFQRLHTREQYPGTGIGLALCKKVIERFGGRIWLDSEPRAGSTFHFTLPAATLNKPPGSAHIA